MTEVKNQENKVMEVEASKATRNNKTTNEHDVEVAKQEVEKMKLQKELARLDRQLQVDHDRYKAELDSKDLRFSKIVDVSRTAIWAGTALTGFIFMQSKETEIEKMKIEMDE